eukprot:326425_1
MALSTFYLPIVVSEELHQATCIIEGAVKRKFQQAQNKKNSKFRTEQFTLHGCNWELNIYPNGDRLDSAGYVSVFLRCKSLPNGCDKIGVNVTIDCVEFNETFSGTYVYTEDSGWGCPQFLRRDRIYLSYHNQITIKISIDGIATFKDTCMTWTIYAPLLQRFKSSTNVKNKRLESPTLEFAGERCFLCFSNGSDPDNIQIHSKYNDNGIRHPKVQYSLTCDTANYECTILRSFPYTHQRMIRVQPESVLSLKAFDESQDVTIKFKICSIMESNYPYSGVNKPVVVSWSFWNDNASEKSATSPFAINKCNRKMRMQCQENTIQLVLDKPLFKVHAKMESEDLKILEERDVIYGGDDSPLTCKYDANEAHNSWVTVNCSIQLDEDISEETLRMQQNLKKKYVIDSVIKMEDIALESDVKNNDIDEEYKHLVQDNESRVNAWSNTTKRLRASVEQIKTSGKMANIDHNDRDNDDEKRGNEPSIVYNALYQTFIRNGQLMAQQSKRMNQIINDGHIPKLITTHPRLAKQIESLQSTYDLQTEEGDILNKQYEEVKARRVMLTDTIEKAVQECNETIAIENKLTGKLKQNAQTTASVAEQQSQLTSVSQRVLSLIDAFNKFEHDNTEYIKTINSHINAKWSAFESKWWEWSRIDIMSWFAYKTRERNTNSIDWMNVQKEIAKRNISGESLENFSESTLDLIGIHDFNIAVHLMKEIATLRNRYYKNGDNDEHCTNDGHQKVVPSKFICPLTKRIMKNPVMAFDGNTYEHEAIEKYLKQHGKSPVTNEKAYTLNLYSHRQLQKEIQSYSSLNDFVESNEGCLMEDEETGNTVDVD